MQVREVRDRERLDRWFRQRAAAHAYALADLEEPFWSRTRWFLASAADGAPRAAAFLMARLDPPVYYALGSEPVSALVELTDAIAAELRGRLFLNVAEAVLESLLAAGRGFESEGEFIKMALAADLPPAGPADPEAVELGPADRAELDALYASLPPEEGSRFFEGWMLELGPYLGVRRAGELVCAGGVHVRCPRRGVAAIGNLATRPDWRGRGLARSVTAELCRRLRREVPIVALNVSASNAPALHCYRRLGFAEVARYCEGVLEPAAA